MLIKTLADFVASIEPIIDSERPPEALVGDLRSVLLEAIRTPRFLLNIYQVAVESLASPDSAAELYCDHKRQLRVRMIFWPASYSGLPHEHHTWTVSAIVAGSLRLSVYEHRETHVEISRIATYSSGSVGSLVPPCIHAFSNPETTTAVSLHVFCDRTHPLTQAPPSKARTDWFAGQDKQQTRSQFFKLAGLAIAQSVRCHGSAATPVLERLFELGDRHVKLAAARAACEIECGASVEMIRRLASTCPEPDKSRLLDIARRLPKRHES